MKKNCFILITALVGVVAGIMASNARINHVIYTRDPLRPGICNVPVFGKSMIPLAQGSFYATSWSGASCIPVMTYDLNN